METHRSTPKDGWNIGENGQIYAVARPQDIERYCTRAIITRSRLETADFENQASFCSRRYKGSMKKKYRAL